MANTTIVGVDLAKDIIQVCVFNNMKIYSNTEMTPSNFSQWLCQLEPCTIIFEACGTSNYWKQQAHKYGHQAKLISAKLVDTVRQNQKSDKNDALAIIQAAKLPNIKFISGKSAEQQQLQSIMRFRELSVKQKTALHNQLIGILLELNIRTSTKNGGLRQAVQSTLEDAENGLSAEFREALNRTWSRYQETLLSIETYDKCLEKAVRHSASCQKLMKMEGVGLVNSVNLYNILIGSEPGIFKNGKDAAACIGLTPVQHSSGGKVRLGSVSKKVRNSMLRSQLVTGAFTYVNAVSKRQAKTKKDQWLKELIDRRGKKCAAVALANKTVRTAFSILTNGTHYQAEPLR